MKCIYCEVPDKEILFQDEELMVIIKDLGLAEGHLAVLPKQHYTILEMVPNEILEKLSVLANKVGIAVFESLGVHGTNFFVRNGLGAGQSVPHFAIEIIPRNENDGLDLLWQPQQMPEDELAITLKKLAEASKEVEAPVDSKDVAGTNQVGSAGKSKDDSTGKSKDDGSDEDNYLITSIRRIP
jgi:histidine triad (HIT) family protein